MSAKPAVAAAQLSPQAIGDASANKAISRLQGLDDALKTEPENIGLMNQRIDVLIELNRLGDARKTASRAIDIAGSKADAVLLGQACRIAFLTNRHDEAIAIARSGLQKAPGWADFHGVLGLSLNAKGDRASAVGSLERAVNLNPLKRNYRIALGQTLESLGQTNRAERVYRHAALTDPSFGDAFLNLGNILQARGSYEEAAANYDKSIRFLGLRPHIYGNYGALERKRLRYPAAHTAYRRAQILKPNDTGIHYNVGNLLRAEDRLDEAIKAYKKALFGRQNAAGVHWNLSLALLAAGYLEDGFREYEWRWRYEHFPSKRRDFKQPMWDGSPLNGRTLLVHTEQGLGDVLQFLRFLPGIVARKDGEKVGRVIFEVHDTLMTLIGDLPGVDQTIQRFDTPPHFDVHLPLLSAPLVLGTRSLKDLPSEVPYLDIPSGPDFPIPEADPNCLKVGFVWAGNPKFSQDAQRSTDIDHYMPLFSTPGIQWFCLQKGEREPEVTKAPSSVVRLNERIKDFRDTAVIMTKLDLVISTCTSVAHLAGALGVPTLVLLSRNADWRWMVNRSDSPWYPSAELIRQKTYGDWAGVFADLQVALEDRVKARR
jgi:tetratricopeptide (TPR) repeat protein